VKLIKKGKLLEEKTYIGVCLYCSSIMKATQKELKVSSHRNETYYYAKCLLCESYVNFIDKTTKQFFPQD